MTDNSGSLTVGNFRYATGRTDDDTPLLVVTPDGVLAAVTDINYNDDDGTVHIVTQ